MEIASRFSLPFAETVSSNGSMAFNEVVRDVGQRIFELADQHRPRFFQKAFWLDRLMRFVDSDERLRTRAFQFVDCLPALTSNGSIARHLAEYLQSTHSGFTPVLETITSPGPLQSTRHALVGWAARRGAASMAARFVAGFDVASLIHTVESLRRAGMTFTLDVLGESTTSNAQADRYFQSYHQLIDRLTPIVQTWPETATLDCGCHGTIPRLNLSVKLSGLDPHFDPIDPEGSIRRVGRGLRPLLLHARQSGAFVNVDMESNKHHDLTIQLFQRILSEPDFRDWPHVGIVLQAYLKRGEKTLAEMLHWARRRPAPIAIRLVKGAYWDAEVAAAVRNRHDPPVWTRKRESDACFERMAQTLLKNIEVIRPAFASHNVRSLAAVLAAAKRLGLSPRDYEVQMLFGMGDPLKHAMVRLGLCVRVYCPYGALMPGMGYLIRRLLENSSNEGFLKQSFEERGMREKLLVDPAFEPEYPTVNHADARIPSPGMSRSSLLRSSLPRRHYQDSDPEEPMSEFVNATNTSFASAESRSKMLAAIRNVRTQLGRRFPLLINGKPETTQEWFTSHNPSRPSESIGQVALGTACDADRAVAAASKASGGWRRTTGAERADLLRKLAEQLEKHRFDFAATMVLEVGKPWREADADVTEAIDHSRYYAEQIERITSRPRLRNVPGEDNMLTYSPKGVCAVLSPWPFPLAILTGMTTAPLAAGNTVVLKPARQASVTAAKLVNLMHEVGFPPGVVNFLSGDGAMVGRHLVEHAEVRVVAFTGSREVGTTVLQAGARVRPGQSFIRKMIVEMGGKNAIIVDDDADLDGAVRAILESAFAFAGQKCSSCSRVIVVDSVHDSLCKRLAEATESAVVGPAETPSTTVGPVIDAAARDRIREYIELGRSEGRLLVEAPLSDECGDGYFVAPTVFNEVAADARIAQEEILGPVLVLLRARDFDEAIRLANGTSFALTGGVFSRSPAHIQQARGEFAAGNLYINRKITGSQVDTQPFGGFRLSGTGVKAGSPDYLLHFMDARCITENTLRSGLVPNENALSLPG